MLRNGDLLGIVNTGACLVHCLALPLLVSLGATFMLHPGVTIAFIVVAFLSVLAAVRSSGNRGVGILLYCSLALFTLAVILEHDYPAFEIVSYVASGMLITGHLLNRRALLRMKPSA